ncbi:MAG TPA: DNA polymerase IV, partial [Kosmotogaceae bacterium]|nr:DNA polymerase IV [Kosmotogaceae bacterium]
MDRVSYIAHVDMDAFFASVEQATNPSLKGKPIIVTGSALRHSVVTAASYEAKRQGVKSGMTVLEASKLCPEAIPVEVDGKKYEYYSETVMKMLQEVSPSVAISSIDEAFVDLSYFR